MKDLRVIVTAGPTREYIDPVRYISNPSTGKMGYNLAQCAVERCANVTLISGPSFLNVPEKVEFVKVQTTNEMACEVLKRTGNADILIMAAAPVDFQPVKTEKNKIKKASSGVLSVTFKPATDILSEVSKLKINCFVTGFAAETENLIDNAFEKIKKKKLDMIVANDVSIPGAGFESETNKIFVIHKDFSVTEYPMLSKYDTACKILDEIENSMKSCKVKR